MTLPWKGSRAGLIAAAAKGRRLRFLLCCAATFLTVAFSFINPQIIRFTIDFLLAGSRDAAGINAFAMKIVTLLGGVDFLRRSIWIAGIFVIAIEFLTLLCDGTRRYLAMELGETVAKKLRDRLYEHIQKLTYDWHVGCQTGDIIQRCTSDVDTIRTFIQNQASELMRTASVFVIALIMMFSMDTFMSLVSLALVPFVVVFSILYFRTISREFNRADILEGVMQAAAQENYTGVRVVRAFGREAYEMEKFAEKTLAYQDIWRRIGRMLGVFYGAGDFLAGLQLVVIVTVGVIRSVRGQLSPGTFLAFYTYCNWMIWPVRQLGRILADYSRALVSSGRVREILSAEAEEDSPGVASASLENSLCFENVSFRYGDGENVLRDISFTLKRGESLAILGATGSGKSTLVHLILRLYDLKEGEGRITFDGVDIRHASRSSVRRIAGLCLQEPFLFSKSIHDNIAMAGSGSMSRDAVTSAAETAAMTETIEGLEQGYDTVIGERGVTLSGGQKQRLAIARMLAGAPRLMIFDDSLSAVDTETDARIRAALGERSRGAAVIIISHRISSLMAADKILVLKDGTIEALGCHEELLAEDGTYRRIWELQRGLEEES